MATENQLKALRNWLSGYIPEGEAICEMPAEVCSATLTKLHEASEAYKNGNKNGDIKKAKKEIIDELREQGWIGVPADEAIAQLHSQVFGDRAQAEIPRIREEQGHEKTVEEEEKKPTLYKAETVEKTQPAPPKPTVPELIAKYTDMLAQVTEAINAEDRIPEREKGYGIKFVYYSVKHALENGGGKQDE